VFKPDEIIAIPFIEGLVGAAALELRPSNAQRLTDEVLASQGMVMFGATVGLVKGIVLDLWDNVAGLLQLLWLLSPAKPLTDAVRESIDAGMDPKGHQLRKQAEAAELRAFIDAVSAGVGTLLADPGFIAEFGEELGEIAGRGAAEWFNDDFMARTPYEKGEAVGELSGRALVEVLLLFLGPEELLLKPAALAGRGTRLAARAEEMAARLAEHVPQVRKLLELREARVAAKGAVELAEAGRAAGVAEEVVTTSGRRIRSVADLVRHYNGRLRVEGNALGEIASRARSETVGVHRRAHASEIYTLMRYLDHGAADGRVVSRLDVIESGAGGRTPDFVLHFADGSIERAEITTLTSAKRGLNDVSTRAGRERQVSETMDRVNVTPGNLARAVRDKAKGNSQLLAAVPGVPTGGTLVVNVSHGNATAQTADAAIALLNESGLGAHVRHIEFTFMEQRSIQEGSRRVVRTFERTADGTYRLVPRP
jgi:hypothetical protein